MVEFRTMKAMNETTGIVEKGTVILPPDQHLPDGIRAWALWESPDAACIESELEET